MDNVNINIVLGTNSKSPLAIHFGVRGTEYKNLWGNNEYKSHMNHSTPYNLPIFISKFVKHEKIIYFFPQVF